MSKKPRKRDATKQLLYAIRTSEKYVMWREAVLKEQVPTYPCIPKDINVHHQHKVTDIVKQYRIKSLVDALACDALWDVSNGVVLTRGEHSIVTDIERYCARNVSVGFIRALETFLKDRKHTARYLRG
jgi:hypothetical protein